jgi:hypothetical protein
VSPKTQMTKNTEFGRGGMIMQQQLYLPMICGTKILPKNNEPMSSVHLPLLSANEDFLSQTKTAWLLQQSKRPGKTG